MKVKLIRPFACAPEGHTVVRFDANTILEGELAKMALDEGSGIEVNEASALETKLEAPVADAPKKKARKG
jgi:hypothetical protein